MISVYGDSTCTQVQLLLEVFHIYNPTHTWYQIFPNPPHAAQPSRRRPQS